MAEEEARIKAEFKRAAKEEKEQSDDDLLVKKHTVSVDAAPEAPISKKDKYTLNLQSD